MRLAELLAVPYIRGAESVVDESTQRWRRRFEYAELPGCAVESDSATEGMTALERARVGWILARVAAGGDVPCPRPPLTWVNVRRELRRLGIAISPGLLEMSPSEAAATSELATLLVTLARAEAAPAARLPGA